MGMPITIEIIDDFATAKDFDQVYDYFEYIDNKFSVYKKESEISLINADKLNQNKFSKDMKEIFKLSEQTKKQTSGYFEIYHNSKYDPSGLVKGWAILNATKLLKKLGFKNFYTEAGGDIQVVGKNKQGKNWVIGIRNPFNDQEIIKTLSIFDKGVATSGTYVRGQHIYNPKKKKSTITNIVALTVIGPNIYEADRFATAAFAMGKTGINFIENLGGFEGYSINSKGIATLTSNFEKYILNHAQVY
jgi:thiamine biosynthesis lipoprotein